jgi:hypothetical protein
LFANTVVVFVEGQRHIGPALALDHFGACSERLPTILIPKWMGFDRGPHALRGGRATVDQGQIFTQNGRTTSWARSYRFVTDFTEPAAHTSLAGGASDRRFSRWYANEIGDWLGGRTKPLACSPR